MDLMGVFKEKLKRGEPPSEILVNMLKEGNLTEDVIDEYMLEHLDSWRPQTFPTEPRCYKEHKEKYKKYLEEQKNKKKKKQKSKKEFFCQRCLQWAQSYVDVLASNYYKMKDLETLKTRLLKKNPGDTRIGKIDALLWLHEQEESKRYERIFLRR